MSKDGYSRKGFFGETVHYDKNGKIVGKSRPSWFDSSNHYED